MTTLPVGSIVKGTKGSETAFSEMLQQIRTHSFTGYLEVRMKIVGGELWGVVVFDKGRLVESYANKAGTDIFGERAYEYLLDISQEAITNLVLHEIDPSNLIDLIMMGRCAPLEVEGMEMMRPRPIPGFETPPASADGSKVRPLPSEGMIKKVVLLGDPAVGKTSLIRRFVEDSYDESYLSTIGSNVYKKRITVPNEGGAPLELTMIIWDIAGQRVCDSLKAAYFRGANAAIVVCDITRHQTLEHMRDWVDSLHEIVERAPVVFVGNKNDLAEFRQVEPDELMQLASSYGASHYHASARTGESVQMIFSLVGQSLMGLKGAQGA
jgi:Ras-related protein Rab-6A